MPGCRVTKCNRGDNLPSATLKSSFFTDATGCYPCGVWDCLLLHLTARPATKALVSTLYLRGRRCTAAPNGANSPTLHVPQPLLHWVRRLCASLTLYGW